MKEKRLILFLLLINQLIHCYRLKLKFRHENSDEFLLRDKRDLEQFREVSQEYFNSKRKGKDKKEFYNQTKYYQSKTFSNLFQHIIEDEQAPGLNKLTFGNLFSIFSSLNCEMFIHGGAIRDLILNLKPNDIDAEYFCRKSQMKILCQNQILKNLFGQCYFFSTGHLILGPKEFNNTFESYPFQLRKDIPIYVNEYTTNTLFYDVSSRILIDITGFGLSDTLNRFIRLTINNPEQRYLWLYEQFAKPFNGIDKLPRYWKLRSYPKNYQPAPYSQTLFHTKQFIVHNVKQLWKKKRFLMEQIFRKSFCQILKGNFNEEFQCFLSKNLSSSDKQNFINYIQVFKQDMSSKWFYQNLFEFYSNYSFYLSNYSIF